MSGRLFLLFDDEYLQAIASRAPLIVQEPEVLGGGYVHPYQEYRDREYQREQEEKRRAELARLDNEIAEAETAKELAARRAKAKLASQQAALKAAARQAELEAEINALRMERARLMRLRDDEEAMFLLMLSRPFH